MGKPKNIHLKYSNAPYCKNPLCDPFKTNSSISDDKTKITCKKCLEIDSKRIYLSYSESSSGGGICEGQENDDWPDYETEYNDFTLKECNKECNNETFLVEEKVCDFVPKIGDILHILVVIYTTGNTFGQSCGNWHIEGIYKNAENAHKIKKQILDDTYGEYNCWQGYFEHLEDVHIISLQLMP